MPHRSLCLLMQRQGMGVAVGIMGARLSKNRDKMVALEVQSFLAFKTYIHFQGRISHADAFRETES